MFLKPCEGRIVRDPNDMTTLKSEGQNKPDNIYWRKRLLDGDVKETTPNKNPKKKAI
ncbi:MAG: DUF2635 domain-containing protein [Rhizobiales bacterium]|nr:DUF2635 domain-containing protein [Hyphomicrobiales bacterium]